MRTYLLFLISLFIGSYVNAQIPNWWPTHPMDTRIGDKPQVQPDTVISKFGWIVQETHNYGDNGYIDTLKRSSIGYEHEENNLRLSFAYLASVSEYAKDNNKLISVKEYRNHDLSVLTGQHFYEYDTDGKLIKVRNITYDRYDKDEVITDNTIRYDYSTVNYTDSGYIFNGIAYSFDEHGRLIKKIKDGNTTVYTYYNNELKYEEIYLSQDERSYSKYTRFFEEHGLLTKVIASHSYDPNDKDIREYFYFFSPGNTTSNSLPIANSPTIYGTTGCLIIDTENPEQITTYSLSGQLIKKAYIQGSNQQIPLAKGIYIVKSDSKTTKVIVK